MTTILVSAGDLSGERYAADLVRAIREQRPDARIIGMGGAALAAAGVEIVVNQRQLAVGGIFEALTSGMRILRSWRAMGRCLEEVDPDLVILVDSGGFNLPFARLVRRKSRARILYFIAPQVWAWRGERIRKLAERTDRIAVILPFEKDFYAQWGVRVDFVGHPILDSANRTLAPPAADRRARARIRLGLGQDEVVLGLFPGSRRSEIDQHLDLLLESLRALLRDRPGLRAIIARAPSLDANEFEARVAVSAGDAIESIRITSGESADTLDAVDVALAKPGTITLELLLRGCPMVVTGRVHPWTARIVRRSLRAAYTAMPNLLMGREIVPEHIQEEARAEPIAADLSKLFSGPARERQIEALREARGRLGEGGSAKRTAQIVEELLESSAA